MAAAAGNIIDMRNTIAKCGSGRRISMHPSLRQALADLFARRVERGPTSRQNSGAALIIWTQMIRGRSLLIDFS
jgi:hypothetical protein